MFANCWTESPLIKLFLPTLSYNWGTPSEKILFNIWFKTFSSSYVFTVAKIDVWSFDIFENLCTWLSTYKMYIFGTIPLLRIYKVYKSNSSFFITDCGGYKQF